jgi:hypothetical protein
MDGVLPKASQPELRIILEKQFLECRTQVFSRALPPLPSLFHNALKAEIIWKFSLCSSPAPSLFFLCII